MLTLSKVFLIGLLLALVPVPAAAQTTADLAVALAVVDDLGDPQVVRVRVTNLGPADAAHPIATVRTDGGTISGHTADPQPGTRVDGVGCGMDTARTELACSWDLIPANTAIAFDVRVAVPGPVAVTAQVDPTSTPDPDPTGNNGAAVDLRPASADLAITEIATADVADEPGAVAGATARTSVRVANRAGRAADVTLDVRADRPADLDGPCTRTSPASWTCPVGTLAVGAAAEVALTAVRPEPDEGALTLSLHARPEALADPDPAAAQAEVVIDPRERVPGTVVRHAGAERIATAIAVSQARFAADTAGAVVLARADAHADALAGGPLAAARRAPILLTAPGALAASTAAELDRVLPQGGTVHLMGGEAALSAAVGAAVERAGYRVVRVAGPNRYATAVQVWEAMGRPADVAAADGDAHADAVVAGAAMAGVGGALLLTAGDRVPAELAPLAGHVDWAIGSAAARALPEATALDGGSPVATGVVVARTFATAPDAVGIATAGAFPDALAGGPLVAGLRAPLLLTDGGSLSPAVAAYLRETATVTTAHLLGGTAALSADVAREVGEAIAR